MAPRYEWREGKLFDNGEASSGAASTPAASGGVPDGTLRLHELSDRIRRAIEDSFPRRVWVVAEIAEIERSLRRPHWFFKLCGADRRSSRRQSMAAVLWNDDHRRLFGRGGVLKGAIEPKDGIEVRALVEVGFYPSGGGVRLVVRDIDPTYTLGRLAIERQRLIDALTKSGALTAVHLTPVSRFLLRTTRVNPASR